MTKNFWLNKWIDIKSWYKDQNRKQNERDSSTGRTFTTCAKVSSAKASVLVKLTCMVPLGSRFKSCQSQVFFTIVTIVLETRCSEMISVVIYCFLFFNY